MGREFKFRTWDHNLKWFRYEFDGWNESVDVLTEVWESIKDYNYTIQQSTNLLAKNGEIYEGDIVRFASKDELGEIIFQDIGIVKYSHAAFIVDGSNWGKDDYYLGDYIVEGNQTELEIIGNIFENPEILEKSDK